MKSWMVSTKIQIRDGSLRLEMNLMFSLDERDPRDDLRMISTTKIQIGNGSRKAIHPVDCPQQNLNYYHKQIAFRAATICESNTFLISDN